MVLCAVLLALAVILACVELYLENPFARVRIWVSSNSKLSLDKLLVNSVPLYSDIDHAEKVAPHSTIKLHTISFVKIQIPKGFIGVAQSAEGIAPFKMQHILFAAGYHKNVEFVLENTTSQEQELPAYLYFGEIFLRKYAKILPRIIKTE